jgi:hypothetical protein
MTLDDLLEEISIELESMEKVVNEAKLLLNDLSGSKPTVREKTAAAAFLAQFYGGIENILKRIHRYHGISMPTGDSWHVEIFKRFCKPSFPPFEPIFEENLALDLLPFRKFRHVVYHGYGFQLDWERMEEGLQKVGDVYRQFVTSVSDYLDRLEKERF